MYTIYFAVYTTLLKICNQYIVFYFLMPVTHSDLPGHTVKRCYSEDVTMILLPVRFPLCLPLSVSVTESWQRETRVLQADMSRRCSLPV